MPAIYDNLHLLRQAKGMTQQQVAEAIAVTRQTVSGYEQGRTRPDLETLGRLARLFDADLEEFSTVETAISSGCGGCAPPPW